LRGIAHGDLPDVRRRSGVEGWLRRDVRHGRGGGEVAGGAPNGDRAIVARGGRAQYRARGPHRALPRLEVTDGRQGASGHQLVLRGSPEGDLRGGRVAPRPRTTRSKWRRRRCPEGCREKCPSSRAPGGAWAAMRPWSSRGKARRWSVAI